MNIFLQIWLFSTKFVLNKVQIWVQSWSKITFWKYLNQSWLKLCQYLYLYGMPQKMKTFFQICLKHALYTINSMLFLFVLWLTGRSYKFSIVSQSFNYRVNPILNPRFIGEGPINSVLFVRPSVHSFVCNTVFSRSFNYFFLKFDK